MAASGSGAAGGAAKRKREASPDADLCCLICHEAMQRTVLEEAEASGGGGLAGAKSEETQEQRKERARQRLEERRAAVRAKVASAAAATSLKADPDGRSEPAAAEPKMVPSASKVMKDVEAGSASAGAASLHAGAAAPTKAEKKASWLGGVSANAVSKDSLKILERLKGSEPIIGGVITLVLFIMFVTFFLLGGETIAEVAAEKELAEEVGELHQLDDAVSAVSNAKDKQEFEAAVAKVAEIMGTNPEDALKEALAGTEAAPALLQHAGDTSWANGINPLADAPAPTSATAATVAAEAPSTVPDMENPFSSGIEHSHTATSATAATVAAEAPSTVPDMENPFSSGIEHSHTAAASTKPTPAPAHKVEAANPSTAILQKELAFKTRAAMPKKLQALYPQGMGLLVGAGHGNFAKALLKDWKAKKLVVMDPFGPEQGTKFNNHTMNRHKGRYQRLRSALSSYKNAEVLRATVKGADGFARRNFDFIYLDGSHEYAKVQLDVDKTYSKLKRGGILAGSDYLNAYEAHQRDRTVKWTENKVPCTTLNSECKSFKGVRAAVEEWAYPKGLTIKSTTADTMPSWFVVKP